MKRLLSFVMALWLLCAGMMTQAWAEAETLYGRIAMLLEEGDGSFCLGLGISSDVGNAPAGRVIVDINREAGEIVLRHEQDLMVWEFIDRDDPDCMNMLPKTLLVLCARWETLTDGMTEDLYVTFRGGEDKLNITLESADDAKAFYDSVLEK